MEHSDAESPKSDGRSDAQQHQRRNRFRSEQIAENHQRQEDVIVRDCQVNESAVPARRFVVKSINQQITAERTERHDPEPDQRKLPDHPDVLCRKVLHDAGKGQERQKHVDGEPAELAQVFVFDHLEIIRPCAEPEKDEGLKDREDHLHHHIHTHNCSHFRKN